MNSTKHGSTEQMSVNTALQDLATYANAFENLSLESIDTELAPLFANNIYFEDPFNCLDGKDQTLRLFRHMFSQVEEPKFIVDDYNLGTQNPNQGFLYWQFHYRLKNKRYQFRGTSVIRWDSRGLILEHIDYWDPAKNLYSGIPVLAWILEKIRKKLALPKEP